MRRYVWLWTGLFVVIAASFAVLGYFGREIYRQAPPVPERVVTSDGRVLFTGQDIRNGQNVWQSLGGQQVGSIWGHGAYVAPDWSADWLHREAMWLSVACTALCSAASCRSTSTTCAPSAVNILAAARPMPPAPPVITATVPLSRAIALFLSVLPSQQ